jgi:hypothetical protein
MKDYLTAKTIDDLASSADYAGSGFTIGNGKKVYHLIVPQERSNTYAAYRLEGQVVAVRYGLSFDTKIKLKEDIK